MRITISLPDHLAQLAKREARRQGISLSAVIQRSLEMNLRRPLGARLPWQGIVSDGGRAARNVDAMLADAWPDRIAVDR
ncbi:MAG: hypothetical protein F4X11_18485 [Acidobacteria bacterium]|nr:hypothetical protein [Acidobacteriota bacterium]